MTAVIKRVTEVVDHPTKDSISIVTVGDAQFVAQKVNGTPRYAVDELVTFVADASIVPEYLLRKGYWDEEKNQGVLKGKGNRVKAGNFASIRSDGIHFEVQYDQFGEAFVANDQDDVLYVTEGQDVSEFLGITEWTP